MFGAGGYGSGGYQNQRVPYKGHQVTGKIGSMPASGNDAPFKFGGKSKDPFGDNEIEESKYRAPPSKVTKPAAKKPVAKNTGSKINTGQVIEEDHIMSKGGNVFGARPALSSMKKGNNAPGKAGSKPVKNNPKDPYGHVKATISRKAPPFSGSTYIRPAEQPDIPIKGSQGMSVAVTEYADTGNLGQCKFCGRSFNEVSLAKHQRVCQEQPGKKKRRVFDSSKMRIVDPEQKMLQRLNVRTEPKKAPPGQMPKWKAMSLQFRQGLRDARAAESGKSVPKPTYGRGSGGFQDPSLTKCPTCGRSFNNIAAERHVKFCATKAREQSLRVGGKPRGKPQPKTQNRFGKR